MIRLRMPRGTDEVNQEGTRYVVNPFTQIVEVPDFVAHVLLRTSTGAVIVEDDFDPSTDARCPHCGHILHDVLVKEP